MLGDPHRRDPLVRGHALGDPGAQVVGVERAARHDDRDGDLPGAGVRTRDDRGVGHVRMADQDRLELRGRHLQGGDLDQLLEPIDDRDAAVLVDRAEIARAQPAVGRQDLGGGLRAVQVAGHDLRAACPQLAARADPERAAGRGIHDPQLRARHEAPDRAGRRAGAAVGHGDPDSRLRQSVALADRGVRQARGHRALHARAQRRAAGHDELERAEVVPVDHRVGGERRHDGRRDREHRDAPTLRRARAPPRSRTGAW